MFGIGLNKRMLTSMETLATKPETVVRLYDEKAGLYKFVMKDKGPLKSLEAIENALHKLGLSKNEIRVYLYLARSGMLKASEISEVISLHRTETYRILRDLEKIGLVSSVFEKPLKFVATPFEKTLDLLIKSKKLRLELLERRKRDLVDLWVSLPQPEVEFVQREVFQILEGEEQINLKAEEILAKTQREIWVYTSDSDISRFYHSGFLDKLERIARKDLSVRLLTNDSPKSCFFVKKLRLNSVKCLSICPTDLSSFLIVDQEQLLFLINRNNEQDDDLEDKKERLAALWTNYRAFIKALGALFTEFWNTE
jgi:sugar-specific transcriptional regulator TrmB